MGKLLKAKRKEYCSVNQDLCSCFLDKKDKIKKEQEIWDSRDMIYQDEEYKVIKLRVQDSFKRLSKSDGYRLIFLISSSKEIVCFLNIYPKNGSFSKMDISKEELKDLLRDFIDEFKKQLLYCHDVTGCLEELKKVTCKKTTCKYEQELCSL
ncbi:MAG: hypothetical protein LBQ60_21290 [Bacteroidales bacterium]|nr:hypothetical protein [Bacteroidales bacterium]